MRLVDRLRPGAGGGNSHARWAGVSERGGVARSSDGMRGGSFFATRATVVDRAQVGGEAAVGARLRDLRAVRDAIGIPTAGPVAFGALRMALLRHGGGREALKRGDDVLAATIADLLCDGHCGVF